LLLYDAAHLTDDDIPHRTKLRELIKTHFKTFQTELRQELRVPLGRISFTTDLWSDPILRAFMAVTAHYFIR
ncbi:hypothetical protein C8T65DRAFT_538891, partial [Cerioporus squamosus]